MTEQELLRTIEQAARERVTALDLSARQLSTLPPQIGQLTNLTWLNLSGNLLTALPPQIGRLVRLTWLDVSHNQLTSLPPEIGQLAYLMTLNLNDNRLTVFPAAAGRLTSLTRLHLAGNQLTALPPDIGQRITMTRLDVSRNHLTALPTQIGQLANLMRLYLNANHLATLPMEVGRLANLAVLDLSCNCLTTLPPEIGQLSRLRWLDLRGNPLSVPPEILQAYREPATIINYYVQHLVGQKRALNEAKLVLAGQTGVGKSTLARRLINEHFEPDAGSAEGSAKGDVKGPIVQPWQVQVPTSLFSLVWGDAPAHPYPMQALPGQETHVNIRLNVWDFEASTMLHATHPFFLPQRSLFLLVLDMRLDEVENRLEHWLKLIQAYGADSPVIVVGNKADQGKLELDRTGLQNKYKNIRAFVEVSCLDGQGLDTLKTVITKEIARLPHTRDQLLDTWFTAKQRLSQMSPAYITYNDYTRLCRALGIGDALSQQTLIGFLHDLGTVFNFQDSPRPEESLIFNPVWATTNIYKIKTSKELHAHLGILEQAMLDQILPARDYPGAGRQLIMNIMRKFEMCFDFKDSKNEEFLIPSLLSKEEVDTGDWSDALVFYYQYNVLPDSILLRFIVRMKSYIHRHTCWRTGAVLAYQDNKAVVKADLEDRQVSIQISGPQPGRAGLLALIRAGFDAIHTNFPGLRVEEKIPLPGHPKAPLLDYTHLRTLEEMGETSFVPPGLKQHVSIRQILDNIEETRHERHIRLQQTVVERLGEEELRTLCANLGIGYDDLPGEEANDKARQLMAYVEQQGRVADLTRIGQRLRPDMDWGL